MGLSSSKKGEKKNKEFVSTETEPDIRITEER